MDLNKVKDADKLILCKKYFFGGCALLPFLWVINTFWFFNDAFRRPVFDQQQQIKRYWIYSLIGAIVWTAVFCTWFALFQMYRVEWDATADSMSFIIPVGIP